jgi:ABC-2 type transport system permease protein
VKKVWFPREVLVAANVTSWLVSFAIEMAVLAIALIGFGNMTLPWVPLVVAVMLLETVYVLGVALMLSVANVYFRDVQHLVAIGLQIWFYATPIIYPINLVEDFAARHESFPVMGLYRANPMVRFVEVYRDLLYDLRAPDLGSILYLAATSIVTLAVGWAVFRRLEPRLAEEL